MSELISRQAVMDATKAVMKDVLDSLPTRLEDGEEVYDVRTSELDFILNINKALQNAIKALPSETHEIRTETHGVCSDDLISRNAALALVVKAIHGTDNKDIKDYLFGGLRKQLWALPSAEPKTDKWIEESDNHGHSSYFCSRCGTQEGEPSGFCPNCGARMKGADNETN